jgi:uncharacterized membrane protein
MMRQMIFALASACLLVTPTLAQDTSSERGAGDGMSRREHRMAGKMLEGMSPEGQKIMAMEMIDGHEKQKAGQATRKAARDKVRAAMTAVPYNANTLRGAFEEERKLASDQQKNHHEHMITVMSKLSDADRKIFAQSIGNMEQRMMMMRTRRKDGKMKQMMEPMPMPSPAN